MGFFSSLASKVRQGLAKTREVMVEGAHGVRNLLLGRKLDESLITELEQTLLKADVGVKTTSRLIDGIRADFRAGTISKGDEVLDYLRRELKAMWPKQDREIRFAPSGPTVILMIGVNGVGKTTSIAKLCKAMRDQDKSVLLAACDTFRAGAVRQLEIWAERLGVEVVKGQQGGDPAAVAFDACSAALSRNVDVLIVDTAGRLQTQDPLMRQLSKIRSVIARQIPGAPHETLLVLDATAGQNALRQAEEFDKAVRAANADSPNTKPLGISGIFLSKLDGTAKGGIVIAIKDVTSIPVKFVGLGETPADVQAFDPGVFIDALLASEAEVS
ncbi:MAG: signal recognition particle-docking protein FtsY [Phycisphaerales bacterium]|nr:MAG: signal recognition particle-docking protein FtsY [Phycisphaerales bacterium]